MIKRDKRKIGLGIGKLSVLIIHSLSSHLLKAYSVLDDILGSGF